MPEATMTQRTRRRPGWLATLLVCAIAGTSIAQAGRADPPDPSPGATKPVREQNLDGNGLIRVHEQGVADVNVTNSSLPVSVENFPSAIAVSNFPATQDVNVVGGSLSGLALAPVSAFINLDVAVPPDESVTLPFQAINASTIYIAKENDEAFFWFSTPLGSGDILFVADPDDDLPRIVHNFVHPVPVNGVTVVCGNESVDCFLEIDIFGF